jgi:DNA-binding NtrC family response regulator
MKRNFLRIENPDSTRSQRQPNPRQRILVAEAETDMRRLNSEVLIYCGYHVDTADNGAVAWNILRLTNYDLLIISHDLPQLSGVELLKMMDEEGLCLPVIMTAKMLLTCEFTHQPWLKETRILYMPYTCGQLLGKVKNLLYSSASVRQEIAPPPNWRSQVAIDGLQAI